MIDISKISSYLLHGMACPTLPDPMVPSLTKLHRRFLRGRDPLQSELGSDPS